MRKGWMIVAVLAAALLLCAATLGGGQTGPAPADGQRATAPQDPHPGGVLFARLCAGCHTIGRGGGMAPDLAGVTARRPRPWLLGWISDPIGFARTDPAARELLAAWNDWPMPDLGLGPDEVGQVVDYLAAVDAGTTAPAPAAAPGRCPMMRRGPCHGGDGCGRGYGRGRHGHHGERPAR